MRTDGSRRVAPLPQPETFSAPGAPADGERAAAGIRKTRFPVVFVLGLSVLCFSSVPLFLKHFTGFLDAWTVNGIR